MKRNLNRMKKLTWFLLLFIGNLVLAQESPIVKVAQGELKGSIKDGLQVFLGVPFAAPPVGDLRWKAPQAPSNWTGIKNADKFAPGPMQGGTPPSGKSEDCLYLNIWSPAKTAKEKVPVLVWIYGGGFGAGATSETVYNGEQLAKKGVVLVSIAYRVGLLGFLAHPELSAENPKHASGNYGLMDMIAGLEWVKKNIDKFGGDPNRVTIFGESAGGIAVSMLCASPKAKGLFHGAISQSGGSFGPSRVTTYPGENMKLLKDAEESGAAYVKQAGFTSIADLRKVEADKLPGGRGWPIVDGFVIPDDQHILYQQKKYNDVPILVGYNSDEGASFSPPKTPQDYVSGVQKRYGKFADDLIKAYPVGKETVPKTARDLARDAAFGWQTWAWATLQAKTGKSKVYYYYFDQHPDYAADSPKFGAGSPHGQEVAYVFENLDKNKPDLTPSDFAISDAMGTYWTNFAKNLHPNSKGVPNWPNFTNKKPQVMYFQQKPFVGPVPSEKALLVLDKYFEWRRTAEGKDWAK